MAKRKIPKTTASRINGWKKENMALVGASYKKEFVQEFKEACKKLDLRQSDLIRDVMEQTIEKAKKEVE